MYEELTLRFDGIAPLLMHSGRLADPLDTHAVAIARIASKRMKTAADFGKIAELEWNGGLWLSDGRPSVPSEAIESCLVAAGKARRIGPKIKAGVTVKDSSHIQYEGHSDVSALFSDKRFVHRCGVRVNNKTVIRTRPIFRQWSVVTHVSYLPSMVDRSTMIELACYAGEMIGIGDYRPRFGRFRTRQM